MVEFEVEPTWWTFAAIVLVLAIDASRTVVSLRGARLYRSDALLSNALHFGSDFTGTLAVLAGLVAAALGFPAGDSIAALFVSALVVAAAFRLVGRNVGILMDSSPEEETRVARRAIAGLDPPVELRRLRLRRAGGEHFADVVIGVAPVAAVGQGHAAADRVERALHDALPGIDVVVHVEPTGADGELRERALAAALTVSHVREIHNLTVLEVGAATEVSLHLKLPGELPLEQAHAIAEQVEAAILRHVPEVDFVRTHLEPLAEAAAGEEIAFDPAGIEAIVRAELGEGPRELRLVRTDDGIVAFLTLGLDADESLADAHGRASAVEERVRRAVPGIADVVIHTEP